MRTLRTERDDRFSTLIIEPPVPQELRGTIPSVRAPGADGWDLIPGDPRHTDEATTITFESRVFGLTDDERFDAYVKQVADHVGATVIAEAEPGYEQRIADATEHLHRGAAAVALSTDRYK